jgi:hypothetical protein
MEFLPVEFLGRVVELRGERVGLCREDSRAVGIPDNKALLLHLSA